MPEVKEVHVSTDTFQELTKVRLMRRELFGGNLDVIADRIDMASDGYAHMYVAGKLTMSIGNVVGWVKKSHLIETERGRVAPCQNL